MEYPIFDVPVAGGALLIAGMATLHVFISHFSVGAGFLMALSERRAIRDNDEETRSSLRRYGFAVLLVPYVLGTVTGVGIWFTIGLVNPRAVSILIHQFVWDWAIEWVLFLVEGTAIYLYVFYWKRMAPRTHNRLGWIFAFSSIGTLVIINGILSFMLTPGDWKPFDAGVLNYKALLNPSYLPTTLARILVSLALAGVGAIVLVSFDRGIPERARRKIIALAYWFMMPAVLCIPLGIWTYTQLSQRAQTFLIGGSAPMVMFLAIGVGCLLILLVAAGVGLIRKDYTASAPSAIMLALLAFMSFGSMEFVREGVRKPYVIEGFMYATGVTVLGSEDVDPRANLASTTAQGVLSASPWALPPGRTVGELDALGRGQAVYRAACLKCHSLDGYNAVRPMIGNWSTKTLRDLLDRAEEVRSAMPPFPGSQTEKDDLVQYLYSLNPHENSSPASKGN